MKTTQQSKNLPPVSALLHNIRADTQDDAFSGDDLQAVMDSEDHFYQEKFWTRIAYYVSVALRALWPEYAFRHTPKRRCCDLHTVIASSQAILESIAPPLRSHTCFFGQGYMLMWHTSCARAQHARHPREAITSVWGFRNSPLSLCDPSLAGPWT